ncbi:MAG: potassium channel family protein [Planctomycetota bacterium]
MSGEPGAKTDIVTCQRHLIVCGLSGPAQHILAELEQYKRLAGDGERLGTGVISRDFVAIDADERALDRARKQYPHVRTIAGDATEDEVLRRAGVRQAYGIFPVLPSKKDNLFITFTAKQIHPEIRVVASTTDFLNTGRKLFRAGAASVVSPSFIGGLRLVSELVRPHATAFLDEMLRTKVSDVQIQAIRLGADSPFRDQTIAALSLPSTYHVLAVALVPAATDAPVYNPPGETQLRSGDALVVFGKGADIARVQEDARAAGPGGRQG